MTMFEQNRPNIEVLGATNRWQILRCVVASDLWAQKRKELMAIVFAFAIWTLKLSFSRSFLHHYFLSNNLLICMQSLLIDCCGDTDFFDACRMRRKKSLPLVLIECFMRKLCKPMSMNFWLSQLFEVYYGIRLHFFPTMMWRFCF